MRVGSLTLLDILMEIQSSCTGRKQWRPQRRLADSWVARLGAHLDNDAARMPHPHPRRVRLTIQVLRVVVQELVSNAQVACAMPHFAKLETSPLVARLRCINSKLISSSMTYCGFTAPH